MHITRLVLPLLLVLMTACTAGSASKSAAACREQSAELSSSAQDIERQFSYDVAHTGIQPGLGPSAEPSEVWRFTRGEPIQALQATDQGLAVSAGTGLYLLDPDTGEEIRNWVPVESPSPTNVTMADGPTLLAEDAIISTGQVDNFGGLYSYAYFSGNQRWNFSSPLHLLPVPIPTKNVIYVATGHEANPVAVYAVDAESGESLWRFVVPESESETMSMFWMLSTVRRADYLTVGDHQIFLNIFGSSVYGIARTTGERCWRSSIQPFSSAVAYADGTVFVPDVNELYAVDAETGEKKWSSSGKSGQSSPAVADGVVYIGGEDGSLYALGARSGDQKWSFETGDFSKAAPSVAGDSVYAVSADGVLYALSVATGTRLWSYPVPAPSFYFFRPIVAGGMVFVVDDEQVIALR